MGGFVFTHPLPRLLCYNRAMISYELASELKEAGYPRFGTKWAWAPVAQKEKGELGRPLWKEEILPNNFQSDIEFVAAPTLEELIEACGESFLVLEREADKWIGGGLAADTSDYRRAEGSTAAEAIARLWLALHKT
jgi:hypothetical protein